MLDVFEPHLLCGRSLSLGTLQTLLDNQTCIGVNRPAFGGTVPHFHQMSRGPAKSADVPHFLKMVFFFFVADYSTCLPRNATK